MMREKNALSAITVSCLKISNTAHYCQLRAIFNVAWPQTASNKTSLMLLLTIHGDVSVIFISANANEDNVNLSINPYSS